ncbi:MAG: hypothetical protein OHK0029_31440 [Armatimonadaceae bacterium]
MSERLQRFLIWFFAIALTVGTGVALRYAGGYRRIAGFEAPSLLPPNVSLRLLQIRAAGRKDNRTAWTMTADQIDSSYDRSQVTFLGNILLTLLDDGKPRATLSASTATYLANAQTLTVTGNVTAKFLDAGTGAQAAQFTTDVAQWNIGAKEVRCPNSVTLTLKDGVVRGNQLIINLQTRDHEMSNFQAEFIVDESGTPPDPFEAILPSAP